jgi:hypothetical protein
MTPVFPGGPTAFTRRERQGLDSAPALSTAVRLPSGPPMRLEDWVFLNAEDNVIVRLPDGRIFAGLIDAVANDASVFWLWVDGGGGRLAIHEEEGCQLWRPDY